MTKRDKQARNIFGKVLKWQDQFEAVLLRVGGFIVVFMMLATVLDVTLRWVFVSPISGIYEIVALMLAVVVFFPLAWVQSERTNIHVTFISERLPARVSAYLDYAWIVITFVCFVLLVWQNYLATIEAIVTHDVTLGTVEVPTAPSRGVITFGFAILLLRLFRQVFGGPKTKQREEKEAIEDILESSI